MKLVSILALALGSASAYAGPFHHVDLDRADTVLWGDSGDRFGTDVVSGDLNDDGVPDLAIAANGAVLVFFGPIATGDLDRSQADVEILGTPGTNFGQSLAIGDVTGSSAPDLVVGAPRQGQGGAVLLYETPLPPGVQLAGIGHQLDGFVNTTGNQPWCGYAVATANLDGTGKDELVVGCPRGRVDAGDVYLVAKPDQETLIRGVHLAGTGMFGLSVANAGDVDGDGLDDVLAGAPFHDAAGTDAGQVALVFGDPLLATARFGRFVDHDPIELAFATHDFAYTLFRGRQPGAQLGWSVAGAHDLNDDGYDDVLLGAPGIGSGGSSADGVVHAILGGANPAPHPVLGRVIIGINGVEQVRAASWLGPSGAGFDVDGAGDTTPSLPGGEALIGSYGSGGWLVPWEGALGPVSYVCELEGEHDTAHCDGPYPEGGDTTKQVEITLGTGTHGRFTRTFPAGGARVVAGVGDLSGDGIDDLAFGDALFTLRPNTDLDHACGSTSVCLGRVSLVNGAP